MAGNPFVKSKVANMLHKRYYVGIVTFGGVEYVGRHEQLITPELFTRVQDILSGRRYAGEKHRTHQHYLKGSVFCGQCRSRLTLTFATGRHGGTYLYFFCLGRQRRNGCVKKYVPIDLVDKQVEDLYALAQLHNPTKHISSAAGSSKN